MQETEISTYFTVYKGITGGLQTGTTCSLLYIKVKKWFTNRHNTLFTVYNGVTGALQTSTTCSLLYIKR